MKTFPSCANAENIAGQSKNKIATRRFIPKFYGARPAKEIFFFVSFAPAARHNRQVIGAFLNALGILFGALLGLAGRGELSAHTQTRLKSALGAFTAFCGLQLVWLNVSGSFTTVLKQLFLALLAVVLGNLLGKILRLQKLSNRLGRHAAALIAAGQSSTGKKADGFIAGTILFSAAPLGILGAVTNGLADYFYPLAVKAVMDGLATIGFVQIFRWSAALAAIPVFFFLNDISLAVHTFALPWLTAHHALHTVSTTTGLVICATALVVLEVRRVELANYLPAPVVAALMVRILA
jgi:uncharacterized membrane protein YqgA involved in biofilm formation